MGANCSSAQKKKRATSGKDGSADADNNGADGSSGRRVSCESVPYGEIGTTAAVTGASQAGSQLPPAAVAHQHHTHSGITPVSSAPRLTGRADGGAGSEDAGAATGEDDEGSAFPESVVQLLWGRRPVTTSPGSLQMMAATREAAAVEQLFANISKQITIYTISTSDWLAERKFLMDNVFGGVREFAQKLGYALNFVDLHWALNYGKIAHAKVEALSRVTIDRLKNQGKLVALVLLDEKAHRLQYTLPPELPAEVFQALLSNCTDHAHVVQRFYKLSTPGKEEGAVARLFEPRVDDISNDLHAQLVDAFLMGLSPAMKDKYLVSLIESELRATVFAPSDLSTAGEDMDSLRGRHAIWLERRAHTSQQFAGGCLQDRQNGNGVEGDADGWQARRYNHLRGLLEDNLTEAQKLIIRQTGGSNVAHSSYLKELSNMVQTALEALIKGVRDEDSEVEASSPSRGIPDSLYLELCEQARLKEVLLRQEEMTTGESEFCKLLLQRLAGGKLFIVHSNKNVSHMAAHIINSLASSPTTSGFTAGSANMKNFSRRSAVLFRFCNRTVNSSSVERLVRSLQEQLCFLTGHSAADASASLDEHRRRGYPFSPPFTTGAATSENGQATIGPAQFVILLDAQFGHNLGGLCDLIPESLAPNVSLIVLSRSGTIMCERLKAVDNLDKSTVELQESIKMSPELEEAPLFDLDALISKQSQEMFEGVLACSRYGLMERDIMDLLSTKPSYFRDNCPMIDSKLADDCRQAPYALWAVFAAVNNRRLVVQNHAGRVVYLLLAGDAEGLAHSSMKWHDMLYDFFDRHWNREWSVLVQDELAFQKIRNNKMVPNTYYDLDYLFKRLCMEFADPYAIIEELRLINDTALRAVLESASFALRYDASQLITQLCQHIWVAKADEKFSKLISLLDNLEKWRAPSGTLTPIDLISALVRSEEASESDQVEVDCDNTSRKFSNLYALKENKIHVVSISKEASEICVWNSIQQRAVRRLYGLNQPRELRLIDDRRALVLCNRELRVYDLDAGQLVVKLKGVMHQQMAFFGLHSANYVVALSRNRMYVNMVNLQSGDLETTFKVGEDRFLNSLLVSANGRICVCGDETQKPFPLLVWDLDKRKLLYDLRIAHHEFLTRLSAISSDGHYVVCVCRELADGAPNFIIVYDLQSGTLFKKWKPQRSSVSIAVSSRASLVLNGLDNSLLVVWDLTTGQRKHTLKGHTAPVDQIRLEPEMGQKALTYSSQQHIDGSVRVWDVDRGVCIAVYTPCSTVLCAQILPGGESCVLALEGHNKLVACALLEKSRAGALKDAYRKLQASAAAQRYGSEVHRDLEVDLKDV